MTRTALSLAVLSVLAVLPALAKPAAAQNVVKWGAIAFGGPDRKTGAAVDLPSAGEAREAALGNCGAACPRTIVFYGTCAAVAESPSGGLGWASNRWRGRAQARALVVCQRSGPGCAISAWACTVH